MLPGRLACGQRHSLRAEPCIWPEQYGSLHDVHLPHCLSQLSLLAYIFPLLSTVILIKTTITIPLSSCNQVFHCSKHHKKCHLVLQKVKCSAWIFFSYVRNYQLHLLKQRDHFPETSRKHFALIHDLHSSPYNYVLILFLSHTHLSK